jgi:hypothetical protein
MNENTSRGSKGHRVLNPRCCMRDRRNGSKRRRFRSSRVRWRDGWAKYSKRRRGRREVGWKQQPANNVGRNTAQLHASTAINLHIANAFATWY